MTVTGTIRLENRAIGGVELGVKAIEIHQIADEYPISPKEHGTAFLMDNRHLWIRSKKQYAILKIRHQVIKASRDFFDNNDFVLFDSPMQTANAAEGTTSLFNVDYYDRTAFLSQTGQLYGEAGAMDYYREAYNLPPVMSDHNDYYLWGYGEISGNVVISIGEPEAAFQGLFEEMRQVAVVESPYAMPYETDLPIYLCLNLTVPLKEIWPEVKSYI